MAERNKHKSLGISEHPLTYQEKKNLSIMIRSLETEDLLGVWEIVSEGNQQMKEGEIEFDIETLSVRKARELEQYVRRKLTLIKERNNSQSKQKVAQNLAFAPQVPSHSGVEVKVDPQQVNYLQESNSMGKRKQIFSH
jgi:hypothetical protein